jgi:hypothetical protein
MPRTRKHYKKRVGKTYKKRNLGKKQNKNKKNRRTRRKQMNGGNNMSTNIPGNGWTVGNGGNFFPLSKDGIAVGGIEPYSLMKGGRKHKRSCKCPLCKKYKQKGGIGQDLTNLVRNGLYNLKEIGNGFSGVETPINDNPFPTVQPIDNNNNI